jgi:LDH2 family malate/lactate/ureidoglycolate dehydrogenase
MTDRHASSATSYPIVESDSRVSDAKLLARVEAIFARCSMLPEDARLLADSLVTADARGVHSHGVLRVPDYVRKLLRDGVDPRGRPRIIREFGAIAVLDACNSMGQIACAAAMKDAVGRAGRFGIGAVAVRGSNHCGALFYTSMQALKSGMIGLVTTNAIPTMAPWGGRDKILGINPLAIAIPSGNEPPIIFDGAFSVSSHGKIRVYHQKGLQLPEGWALDASGQPTTDPAAAICGLLQPIGAFKGAGLAVISGVLSSFLSGAAFGTELGDMVSGPAAGQDGHFVIAIQVSAFEDLGLFTGRVDGLVRQIRNCTPAAGFERCYAPGELEYETELGYRAAGIPLSAETLAGVAECERELRCA